jgi:hypothetical protein
MKKLVIGTSLALALAATPALAASYHARVTTQSYGSEAYAQSAGSEAYAAAFDRDFVVGGPALFSNGKNLGWDPDPRVRLDLLRLGDPANVGGN